MKKILLLLTIVLTSLSLFAATAEAKRFGGGSSFGKQRSVAPQQAQKAPGAAPAATPSPAAAAGSKWVGPLAGLAIGAGLATMFAGGLGGLGGAMGNILMMLLAGAAVMFLISMFRKKQSQQTTEYAGAGAPYNEPQQMQQPQSSGYLGAATTTQAGNLPEHLNRREIAT